MDDRTKGLYEKYRVERTDGKPVDLCVVLEVDDPNTHDAIRTFAATVRAEGYGLLATDLERMLPAAAAAAPVEGRVLPPWHCTDPDGEVWVLESAKVQEGVSPHCIANRHVTLRPVAADNGN